MEPINLHKLFGDIYQITLDPAAAHDPGGRKNPWYQTIPCRKGNIFPHSDKLLALWWESTGLFKQPFLTIYQNGDGEKVYLFKPEDFVKVFKLVGPKRRRKGKKLSPAARKAAIARTRPHRFTQKSKPTQP